MGEAPRYRLSIYSTRLKLTSRDLVLEGFSLPCIGPRSWGLARLSLMRPRLVISHAEASNDLLDCPKDRERT